MNARTRCPLAALLLAACAAQAAQVASAPAGTTAALTASNAAVAAVGCLLLPARVSDIGTPTAGVVEQMAVDRGDRVRAGQVLVRLKSDTERASLLSAQTRAEAEAAIGAARAAAELARSKLDRAQDLYRQQFISSLALDQAKAESAVAEKTLQQAVEQRAAFQGDLEQARAALSTRVLTSPIDGIVIDRMANPGERVELRPLLRVADVSNLHAEVVVPARLFGGIAVGGELQVHPEVPNAPAKAGRVTQVDQVIDAASNTFRVRLLLPNGDGRVPAGARCRVDLPSAAL